MKIRRLNSFGDLEDLLFLLILVCIPFTDFDGYELLGEMKYNLSAHIALFSSAIYIFHSLLRGKFIAIKHIGYYFLLLFLVACFFSVLLNWSDIISSYYKGRSGLSRVISQSVIFISTSIVFCHYFYNIFSRNDHTIIFLKIRKVIMMTLYLVLIFAIIEILAGLYYIPFFQELYADLSSLLNKAHPDSRNSWILGRITSVCYEPPFLAMYLIFVLPFGLSYIYTGQKIIRLVHTIVVIGLVLLSGSRAAFIVIFFQCIVFLTIGLKFKKLQPKLIRVIRVLGTIVVFLLLILGPKVLDRVERNLESLSGNKGNKHASSNMTRLGTQFAAFDVFLDSPVLGVGLGQSGYYLPDEYPDWAVEGSWEIRLLYKDNDDKTWPPNFSLLTRLLSETGLVGLILFSLFNFAILFYAYKGIKKTDGISKIIEITLITTLLGLLVNYLQFDSLRLVTYWIVIAFLMSMHVKRRFATT